MATTLDPAVQLWVDHTPLAIAFFDHEMRYLMASQRWRQDYNLGDQPLVGRSHYEVFPDISDEWKAIHQRCLKGDRDRCEEAPFLRADGQMDWLRWDVHPWHDRDGAIGGILMITEIITAQKEATQALAAENARLQAEAAERAAEMEGFFNLTLDFLCVAGFDGYFKRVNPVFETLLGYSQAELMAQPFLNFVHPDDQASTQQVAARLSQGHGVVAFENRYRCKDGTYRWLAWTSFPDLDRQLLYATARDVTDLKTQEITLRQQAQVLDQVKGAIVATDLQGLITRWSRGAEALYGYSAQEILGQPVTCLYAPEEQATVPALLPQVLAQGFCEAEVTNYHQAGHPLPVLLSLSVERDDQGEAVGFLSHVLDRSEHKQQEQFLRSVFEGSEHPIFVVDVTGGNGEPWTFRYQGWNRAAEVYVQIPRTEIIGKTPIEAFGPDAGGPIQLRYEDCACQGSALHYEESMVLDRGEVWWLTSIDPLINDQGQVYRLVGTATEITARKQAEMELQTYADRQALINQLTQQIRSSLDVGTVLASTLAAVRQLLRLGYCAFGWYEPEGPSPTWQIFQESLSLGMSTQVGTFPADVVGINVEPLMAGQPIVVDRVEDYPEPVHRRFLQEYGFSAEVVIPIRSHGGGQRLGVLICASEHQAQPWPTSTISLLEVVGAQLEIAIDQAELYADSRQKSRELEEALRELQRTQVQIIQAEKMSSLGQLVAGVAHEINNPVNFIYGNLTHAKEYVDDLLKLLGLYQAQFPEPGEAITAVAEDLDVEFLGEDLPKLLNSMKVGAERIRGIVSSLRVFSRMDEAEVKAVDVHEGIESTLVILQNRLKRQPHRPAIALVKQYGDLPLVECYPGQLNQVFMNLLSNAIDALEEAHQNNGDLLPQIAIRTHGNIENNQAVITLIDNGSGIPEAVRSRIFDPFFTTKPVGKGTGMGLSISYQIITERHGGAITCDSTPGEGTRFTIAIPIRQPRGSAA